VRSLAAAAALTLAACAGGPPIPEWRTDAQGALRNFESAYLAGRSRIAEQEFARARAALAATGRADLVARAELVRCAARVASLDLDDCPGFRALAADAPTAERAYAAFLAGEMRPADAALLPEHHRALAAGGDSGLAAIEDPLSRLVAAGVLFRQARMTPPGIVVAVETASANGWRRPLLAWLGVQEKRAREAGDADAAAALRRRIRLVAGEEGGG
jgi:hypothetical protein